MSTFEDAVTALGGLLETKAGTPVYYKAISGDGANADTNVAGKPGFTWVRYHHEQSKAAQVLNRRLPNIETDVPVIIGKEFETDADVQILAIDITLYIQTLTLDLLPNIAVGKHGLSHYAPTGADPSPIDLRNIIAGLGRPTHPPSLWVYVNTFRYIDSGVQTFAPASIDLSGYEPVAAATHCYVLVYVDIDTGALGALAGADVAAAADPVPPACPGRAIPICLVDYVNGDAAFTENEIYDYRVLWLPNWWFVTEPTFLQGLGMLQEDLQRQIDDVMSLCQALLRAVLDQEGEAERLRTEHVIGDYM